MVPSPTRRLTFSEPDTSAGWFDESTPAYPITASAPTTMVPPQSASTFPPSRLHSMPLRPKLSEGAGGSVSVPVAIFLKHCENAVPQLSRPSATSTAMKRPCCPREIDCDALEVMVPPEGQ